MNLNVQEVFNKIFQDEELLAKFMEIDDDGEMYEFCLSIEGGYTKSEFEDYLFELLKECMTLENEDLEMIAGGVGGFKKILAGTLAVASMFSSTNLSAVSIKNLEDGYISVSAGKKEIAKENKNDKLKNGFSKIANYKGKTTLGKAIFGAVHKLFGKKNGKSENVSDHEKRRKKFFDFLDNEIVGQEEAKSRLKEVFDKCSFLREHYAESHFNADLVFLNGPSGADKAACARELAKALAPNPDKVLEVSGPDLIKTSSCGNYYKVVEEFFGFNKPNFYSGDPKDNIGRYIMENPEGVVIINDYDKIGGDIVTKGQINHPLDELLHGISDGLPVTDHYTGEKIDCSKITFIFTANESTDSLKIPSISSLDEEYMGTVTHPVHDGSLLPRLDIVQFRPLSDED